MTARCHFRWGERRHFLYARLQSIIDLETGEILPMDNFIRRQPLPPRRPKPKSPRS
jgi:hypothetical protein